MRESIINFLAGLWNALEPLIGTETSSTLYNAADTLPKGTAHKHKKRKKNKLKKRNWF